MADRDRTISIVFEKGHYAVYIDGYFYCTADTHEEAVKELMNDGIIN